MRVLIVTTVPETLATILKDQPRYLAAHYHVALATCPAQDLSVVQENEGVEIYPVPMVRGINVLSDLVSVARMIKVLRNFRPVLVHSYTPKAGLITMLAAWLCRVPVRVHTFTGLISPSARGFKQKLLIAVDRLICACATHIVPEGAGVKTDLQRFRITRKPLRVIGHGNIAGVDTSYFSPSAPGVNAAAAALRARFSIGADEFVFCYMGRLNKDKGLTELMQAFAHLTPSAHLLLVGEIDGTAPVAADVLAAINSHPRAHATGFLRDVRPALKAADVLVLPSYREGFPNAVLQAGAMQLPVIATNINGCNEVIEVGVNGWLVPVRDPQALEDAMRQAMHFSAPRLGKMGSYARERIKQRFERKQHWENMVAFYDGLFATQRALGRFGELKFLLIAGYADSLLNFRGPLISALQSRGLQVHVAAPGLSVGDLVHVRLEALGVTVHSIPMLRTSTSPLADSRTLWSLWRLMRSVRPDFVMGYTIKPVIYGSIAASLAGVPRRFALITGLGYAFQGRRGRLQTLVQRLYDLALSQVHGVFFQNPDDLALFRERGLLSPKTRSCVVNGSGVDVDSFTLAPMPIGPPCFLLIARLLGDKGVREYAEAARRIRTKYPEVRCTLVGWIDSNPDSIRQDELNTWVADGDVHFLGKLDDVRQAIADCSVYVLPSYREGTPRTVLEAMAMGRAVITTDAPGCRETVVAGDNGFLVPVQSVDALVAAMERFVNDPQLACRMGARGRMMAEAKYDVHKINAVMLKEMGID